MIAETDPDKVLADMGDALAAQVGAAVPGWVVRCVEARLSPSAPGHDLIMARAHEAGMRARQEVAGKLRALLSADVDGQRSTPLAVVRTAVSYPTEVLRQAQVTPAARDPFASQRFPDDPYGLTPASLQAVDPGLGDVAIAWGAAKSMAHRKRHGAPSKPMER